MLKYNQEIKIEFRDVDKGLKLKINSLSEYMQEAAGNHIDILGANFSYEGNEFFWVISRSKITLNAYPNWKDRIIVETYPSGVDRLFIMRNYNIYNEQNQIIGQMIGSYLLMDKFNQKPVRPTDLSNTKLNTFIYPYKGEFLDKIKPEGDLIREDTRHAKQNEMDINNHMNNIFHVRWSVDMFTSDELAVNPIKSIQTNYILPVKEGCELNLKLYKKDENTFYVIAYSKEEKAFWQSKIAF
ncbi:hypothetical protein AN640_08265 [Candidatus Epulonipiscium fishelsonii]|uniref:Uncharacterized protein n=1 Tax=Candidatus Epulonipiscium fishelsonii TaxID=77094 RepID=A0ACC8XE01_9FIRM|nr:hypothetical protein AN640_08265 [Epulopiscium sp. SCG-D08WGA-EpuloA1]OON95510.1 MAG: hypothetical protein ATN32_07085 [Epulopiscium sp. AS2M-Bin002]